MKAYLEIISTLHPDLVVDATRLAINVSDHAKYGLYGGLDQRLALANFFLQCFNADNARGESFEIRESVETKRKRGGR